MPTDLTLSSKGQLVIPGPIRAALRLRAGSRLRLTRIGRQIVLEEIDVNSDRPKISFDEYRRRVPRYAGPAATVEQMDRAVEQMFAERGRP